MKNPRRLPDFFEKTSVNAGSAFYHVGSLHSLGTLGQIVSNSLALIQRFEALALIAEKCTNTSFPSSPVMKP